MKGVMFCEVLYETGPSRDAQTALVEISFGKRPGQINVRRMSLDQGGVSEEPIGERRVSEIRAL